MNPAVPHFELARVFDDGSFDAQIVPVTSLPWDTRMDRRGFLGAGMTIGATLTAMGCSTPAPPSQGRAKPAASTPMLVQNEKKAPSVPTAQEKPAVGNAATTACGTAVAHTHAVSVLAFSPDGQFVYSGGADKTIKFWRMPQGALAQTRHAHGSDVLALAASPDGSALASASRDGQVKIWRLPDGKPGRALQGRGGGVTALAWSPDAQLLAAADDKNVTVWSTASGVSHATLALQAGPVRAMAFSGDGLRLIAGTSMNKILEWEMPAGPLANTIDGGHALGTIVAMSGDGEAFASAHARSNIQFGSRLDHTLSRTFGAWSRRAQSLALSPDGHTMASGYADGSIKLSTLPDGVLTRTLRGHTATPRALVFSPDGRFLVSGGNDKRMLIWSLSDGRQVACGMDLRAAPGTAQGITYETRSSTGQVITYTLPCGSPIPAGAVCTCNCVPGTYVTPRVAPNRTVPGRSYSYCTCNRVCSCIPVRICQAHRLTHPDPVVQTMARELLLIMGRDAIDYLQWAAGKADDSLRADIDAVISRILAGAHADASCWPAAEHCVHYLGHVDEVVAIMAAQMLEQWQSSRGDTFGPDILARMCERIQRAKELCWRKAASHIAVQPASG